MKDEETGGRLVREERIVCMPCVCGSELAMVALHLFLSLNGLFVLIARFSHIICDRGWYLCFDVAHANFPLFVENYKGSRNDRI